MTPSRLAELTPARRRRAVAASATRCLVTVAAIITVYYLMPLEGGGTDAQTLVRLVLGGLLFVAVLAFELRRILRAELPQLQAAETLALALPLFVVLFAGTYVSLSTLSAANFTERLHHTSGLYFTVVTLGTVGYGDITPRTDLARVLVTVQVLLDLAFLALLVRLVVTAARFSLSRSTAPAPPSAPGVTDANGAPPHPDG
jgi:voltage-gated potassium channel